LYERYLIVGDEPANSNEYKTFNENTFVEILKQLRVMNNKEFPYNPDDNEPYFIDSYIYKLYNLLGVDCKMFDYIPDTHELFYSSINKDVDVYKDDKHAPTILIITIEGFFIQSKNNKIYDDKVIRELTSMKEEITYNGTVYILDSVYLGNANDTDLNHAIVGMTCKKKKFVFNGEPVKNERNFPCVLMRHDWNILQDRDFYLWDNDCELHDKPTKADENRYNFSEGKRRSFIYVRKNESRDTSVSKETDVEKYRQEQREAISREQIEAMLLEKVKLEEEIKKARLRYEEHMKAMKEEEEQKKKKKEEMWDEKEEVEHYKEQMALIKKEDEERKRLLEERRVSDKRKLHNSTHQQRKYDIADLIKIISELKLEDDEKENHLPKRKEKRNRKNRSGSDGNSGSKDSQKVIKHPKK
jgi:hypothetical protein